MEPVTEAPRSLGRIALALSKAQAKIVPPEKNKTVTVKTQAGATYTFDYADYHAIVAAVTGPLSDNGIAFTHLLERLDGEYVLVTKLIHCSGEEIESLYPIPRSSDPKAVGGAITYGKRYSLSAITGCVADDDVDADPPNTENFGDRKPPAKSPQASEARSSAASKPAIRPKPPTQAKAHAESPPANSSPPAVAGSAIATFFGESMKKGWDPSQIQTYMRRAFGKTATSALTAEEFASLERVIGQWKFEEVMGQFDEAQPGEFGGGSFHGSSP